MRTRLGISFVAALGLALSSCSSATSYACTDRLGCIIVGPGEPVKIGALLTLTTADAPYGIDALRGVEIAIAHKGLVRQHEISLVKEDDLCSAEGGADGATRLAADANIVGVVGTSCSGASVPASRILSGVGSVLISPSSTAPSLTDPTTHEAGFLRTIYNDRAQGQAVGVFAHDVLGSATMITIHDGTPYAQELQAAACETFEQLGGRCTQQIEIQSGQSVTGILGEAASNDPDVLFFPVYAVDGAAITNEAKLAGLDRTALMSSDGLLSTDFIQQTEPASEGMYLSGPSDSSESETFLDEYRARYGEAPVASYHLQGYDAAMMLLDAVDAVGVQEGQNLYVPRQALRDRLYGTQGLQGLSGTLTCSETGDCAEPNIEIFQIVDGEFKAVYP